MRAVICTRYGRRILGMVLASGAIGTAAVQLARHFGAGVTGVCSTTNLKLVESLGAEAVLDYTREAESGALKPVIDRRYPPEEIVDAHRYVELGHKKGDVIVTVAPRASAGIIF